MTGTTADWTEMDTLKYNQRALEAALTEQDQRITDLVGLVEELAKHLHVQQENLADTRHRLEKLEAGLEKVAERHLDLIEELEEAVEKLEEGR